jgi:probable HAF family extracellular repeat protein
VAGYYDSGEGIAHAYMWDNGMRLDLGTLGGNFSAAKSINNNGQVVGYSNNSLGHTHAFLWENGMMTDLGTLEQDQYCIATSINDFGQVVGYSASSWGANRRPFLWERGIMTDLNDFIDKNSGWILYDAFDINDKGQIVGRYFINGKMRSFLMTPVSESITIDIKPGSDPNSINLKSNGVVPVAILSTIGFEATGVDPSTVLFADAFPVKWTMDDVNQDGEMDLLLHFRTQDLNLTQDSTEATLTGETMDGTPIEGTDTVNIVPKKKK